MDTDDLKDRIFEAILNLDDKVRTAALVSTAIDEYVDGYGFAAADAVLDESEIEALIEKSLENWTGDVLQGPLDEAIQFGLISKGGFWRRIRWVITGR